MAESAVNISSIQQKKPNIFELVAQESLMKHIYPAIKALFLYGVDKNSSIFIRLIKCYEEIYLVLNFVLQYYYLKVFNSSFSEAFYGLRRINANTTDIKSKLSPKVFATSLFFLVFVPYFDRKITDLIQQYELDKHSGQRKEDINLERLIRLKNVLKSSYGAAKLYFLISYTAGHSSVHDPLLKFSRVQLICQDRKIPSWKEIWTALVKHNIRAPRLSFKLVFRLIATSLEIGAFFIQFLNWWHTSDARPSLAKLPVPKPPHISNATENCPLCFKKRKNEVVLITSGYVFCYLCITDYLNKKGKCPITHLAANTNNLVRIYST